MFEHGKCDRRLVKRERLHDRSRCVRAARKHLGHGQPHQRRRVVKQHQERTFGGGAVVCGKI